MSQQRLEKELKRDYHIITADKRLNQVARDFVEHYSTAWETGKAMLVCIDKITCVRMYNLIAKYWQEAHCRIGGRAAKGRGRAGGDLSPAPDRHGCGRRRWRSSSARSKARGESSASGNLDITPHRKLIKEGFEIFRITAEKPEFRACSGSILTRRSRRKSTRSAIAIVCAMWLTGFDVPSLSTLYLDKPLKAHTLMQAIARANRVNEGKNNGLIVDYCGILKNLRKALATFAGQGDGGPWRKGRRHRSDKTRGRAAGRSGGGHRLGSGIPDRAAGLHWKTSSRRPDLSAMQPSWRQRRQPTKTTRHGSASR